MESFSFELKLLSNVEKESKKGASALQGVQAQAKKTQQALDFSKELEKSHAALAKLNKDPGGYAKLLKVQKELSERRKELGRKGLGETLGEKFNIKTLATGAFLGEMLAEGVFKIGEGLVETAHKVVEIFGEGLSKAFEESGKEEKKRLAFKLSLGTEGGKESREDIERFSKLTAYTEDEVAKMFLPLRRAGFSQKAARSAFAAASDIEAGGGVSAQDALDTFEHIKLKGGIAEKKLVGMGVNAPEFYKALAKKLGTSSDTAKKRAEEGKLDPQLLLNTIYEGIEQRQGGKLGTGGVAAGSTLPARLHKLQDLPNQYFEKLVDSPGYAHASEMLGDLLKKLDPESETGQRIMGSLDRMFGRITDKIATIDLDKVASGIEDAMYAAEGFLPVLTGLAEAAAKLAGYALDAASGLKLVMAIQSGDKASIAAASQEIAQRNYDRAYNSQERDAAKAGLGEGRGVLSGELLGPYANPMPAAKAAPGSGKGVQQVNHISVTVEGGSIDDKEAHQKAARKISKHVTDELERAAQMAGG